MCHFSLKMKTFDVGALVGLLRLEQVQPLPAFEFVVKFVIDGLKIMIDGIDAGQYFKSGMGFLYFIMRMISGQKYAIENIQFLFVVFHERRGTIILSGFIKYKTISQLTVINNTLSHEGMSFFDLQPRHLSQTKDKPKPPAPYTPDKHTFSANSYAPFGSLSGKNKQIKSQVSVGPGDYNIQHPIIKPSISKYQNNNIIIVKINDEGGHQFKSKTNRFKSITESNQVGPGAYDVQSIKKKVRASSYSSNLYTQKIRDINNKYCKDRQPTLISDPPEEIAEENKTLSSLAKAKNILSWSLNKKERFDPLIKQQFNIIDKQKALSQISNQRQKKIRPSAIFSSKSMKSHLETQIYKTNNPFKAELRKMIQFKDDQPGPGTYNINRYSKNQRQSKYQFFGSTVERFADKEEASSLGPTSYKIQSPQSKIMRQQHHYSGQKVDRHSYLPKNDASPGVGSYSLERRPTQHSNKSIQHSFGSRKPRFLENAITEEIPTEAYFQATATITEKRQKKNLKVFQKKQKLINQPQAIFSSNTKRFKKQQPIVDQVYDLTQNDINSKISKYRQTVQQLEQCQLHKPPFLSSDERFKDEKVQAQNTQHKDCWCLIKSVEKQVVHHESAAFVSNEKRTTVFEVKERSPPVGYYSRESNDIIKSSFNSRFMMKNDNQRKKNKVFDQKNNLQKINEKKQIKNLQIK